MRDASGQIPAAAREGAQRDERRAVAMCVGQAPSIGRSAAARRALRRCYRVRPVGIAMARYDNCRRTVLETRARTGVLENAAGSDPVSAGVWWCLIIVTPDAQLTAVLDAYSARDAAVALGELREPQDVPRLLAAVKAAPAFHTENAVRKDEGTTIFRYCSRCSGHPEWPCPEVRAISEALEGGDGR